MGPVGDRPGPNWSELKTKREAIETMTLPHSLLPNTPTRLESSIVHSTVLFPYHPNSLHVWLCAFLNRTHFPRLHKPPSITLSGAHIPSLAKP